MRPCKVCGTAIPEGRIKALPGATTCVEHSTTSRFAANVISSGNAEAGDLTNEIEILRDAVDIETLNRYSKQLGSYK